MAAPTTRRKPPAKRSNTVQLGGGLSLSLQRKTKRAVKRNTTKSAEWRATRYVSSRVWRGGRWLAVRSGQAGWNTTTSLSKAATGSAVQWGQDKARFGLTTPLVKLTTADDDGTETTRRVPRDQMRARTAVLLGEAPEPEFRLSGDRVRADEPRSPVWAAATRMDRQVVPMATWREKRKSAMAKELSKLEELFGYEPEKPEEIPAEFREWLDDELPSLEEGFSELAEKMKEWNVNETSVGKVEQIAEQLSSVMDLLKEVIEGVEEQLEHQINTKKAG